MTARGAPSSGARPVKRYGRREAVRGVDLTWRAARSTASSAPTAPARAASCTRSPACSTFDAGDVDVFGVAIDSERAAEPIKDRVGLMPQGLGLNLYPELSVEENIDFFARLRLVPDATSQRARHGCWR